MNSLNDKEILRIHKIVSGKNIILLNIVYTHSQIIRDIAITISKNLDVDKALISNGAMLHDIGVYKCFDNNLKMIKPYIVHGDQGYKILKKYHVPDNILNFTIHHTGVGISKKEIENGSLPLSKRDHIPQTLEERIVLYADKFHSKTKGFLTFKEISENISKLGNNKLIILNNLRKEFGIPSMKEIMVKYKDYGKEWNI